MLNKFKADQRVNVITPEDSQYEYGYIYSDKVSYSGNANNPQYEVVLYITELYPECTFVLEDYIKLASRIEVLLYF